MVLPALLAAVSCRGHAARTAPADPIEAVAPAPLPVGSLGGTNVLLLTVGGVVFADSAALLQPRTDSILAGANAALDTALRRDAREVTWEGLAEQRHVMRHDASLRSGAYAAASLRVNTAQQAGAHEKRGASAPRSPG